MEARFATTRWSLIAAASGPLPDPSRAALGALCEAYWYPLYAFARRSGEAPADAQDLVQGFFARLIEKDWVGQADRDRGRFRTFLLAAFRHFASNERAKARALKRGGGVRMHGLDFEAGEKRYQHEPADGWSPAALYERRFALLLIERAKARLAARYDGVDKDKQERFRRLMPLVAGGADRLYREVAEGLGLTETAVKVAVHRLRRRFGDALRAEVADTLQDPGEVEAELLRLRAALAGGGA